MIALGRYGVWTTPYHWGETRPAQVAGELESLGFAMWLGAAFDLVLTEELLAATDRLVVATGILSIWSMTPDDAAAAYARIEHHTPDRFLLGLGVSHHALVEPSGQRYEHPYRRMVEYLDALDAADPPVPKERRVLAALGPRMLALSSARAGGAHPYLVTPEHTARARQIMGGDALLAPEQKVVLETDRTTARELAREVLAIYLTLPNYLRNLESLGFGRDDVVNGGSDRLVDALVAWGDVDTVVARLEEHHTAGADHVAIQVVTRGLEQTRAGWERLAAVLTK